MHIVSLLMVLEEYEHVCVCNVEMLHECHQILIKVTFSFYMLRFLVSLFVRESLC